MDDEAGMTVLQIRQAKKFLEKDMMAMLTDFEERSGTTITNVWLDHYPTITGTRRTGKVTVELQVV